MVMAVAMTMMTQGDGDDDDDDDNDDDDDDDDDNDDDDDDDEMTRMLMTTMMCISNKTLYKKYIGLLTASNQNFKYLDAIMW